MLDAENKILKGKYEIHTGLPHGESSCFEVHERDYSVVHLVLISSDPGVDDSDGASFIRHTFLIFFGGVEVADALGVSMVADFSSPLAW